MASSEAMASGIPGVGLALLVLGILAVAVGLGLLLFTQDAATTQEAGGDASAGGETDERQSKVAQTISVGGGAVAFLGLIFIVIGRAD